MAVLTLPKLKPIKLTKLQALLLLGGAFVLAAAVWAAAQYRLVLDETPTVPEQSVVAMQFLKREPGRLSDYAAEKILLAMPPEAQQAINLADLNDGSTLFAVPDDQGRLRWSLLEAQDSTPTARASWRIVQKDVNMLGFVTIAGQKQPMTAVFGHEDAFFRVGRAYSGLIGDAPALNSGRRMMASMNQELLYIEKPEGASWANAAAPIAAEMSKFPGLASFWTLPGRVELSVSASHTDTIIQPFTLYYRPVATLKLPRALLETYARELLADAIPHPIDIQLPDGSHMQEMRHDAGGVQVELRQNQFGDIVKFSYPGEKEALYAFYTKDGEAWLTTDLTLVQAILLGNLSSITPGDVCHKGGVGGYAILPGDLLPISNGFKSLTVSIHNLETGVFTMCGYY